MPDDPHDNAFDVISGSSRRDDPPVVSPGVRIVAFIGAGLFLLLLGVWAFAAEPACAPRAAKVKWLADELGQVASGFSGLRHGGRRLVEIYAAPDGTFTIVETTALTRVSCNIAAGTNYIVMDR